MAIVRDVIILRNQTVAVSLRERRALPAGRRLQKTRALQRLSQKGGGAADVIFRHLFRGSAGDYFAASCTRFRPEIDDVVGFGDHTQIVFDDNDRVSLINEAMKHVEEQLSVCHVQADRWFFKQIQCRSGLAHFSNALVGRAAHSSFQLRHQLGVAPRRR